MKEAIIINYL